MKQLIALAIITTNIFHLSFAHALSIRTVPSDVVYVYPVSESRGVYDAVIHAVAVVNDRLSSVSFEGLEIEALKDGAVSQTWQVPYEHLTRTTRVVANLKADNQLETFEYAFHTIRLLGETATPANTPILVAGNYMLGRARHLVFQDLPDELRLRATGTGLDGAPVTAETTLAVGFYDLKNDYILPVAGRVLLSSGADVQTNHRWTSVAEFALDFDATGANTSRFRGDRSTGEEFYIFGRDVLASADGTVVEVVTGEPDPGDFLRRPGEDIEAAVDRVNALNREINRTNIRALCGNRVVIDHGQGEFSLSCHLKQNSVTVAVGDRVEQGQVIGQVGNSGNAGSAHLHFQLSDGPDQFTSRSLPVTFTNVRASWGGDLSGKYLMQGDIVEAAD